jgi:hypothetical protein
MSHNLLTIITTIAKGKEVELRALLRTIDPDYDARTFIRCKSEFRFDKLAGLHFCSFVILEGDDRFDPCLVFEATFDGPKADFIRALLQVAGPGMDKVYQHCEGYPAAGLILPNIAEEYLLNYDVGAHTFFSGCPGRPVGQIVAENRLRSEMVTQLAQMRQRPGAEPTTLNGLREQLQAEVICHQPGNEWAEQAAAVPDAIASGRRRLVRGGMALLGLLSAFVALLLWLGLGLKAGDVYAAIADWEEYGRRLAPLIDGLPLLTSLSAQLGVDPAELAALLALLGLWFVLRFIELIGLPLTENPSEQGFALRYVLWLLYVLRYGVLIFLIGFAILSGVAVDGGSSALKNATKPEAAVGVPWWTTVGILAACGILLVLLRHWITSRRLAVEFEQLTPRWENLRRFQLDVLQLGILLTVWIAALALLAHVPEDIMEIVMGYVAPFVNRVLVLVFYVFATLFLLLALIALVAVLARALELIDKWRYHNAWDLTSFNNRPAYAREEVGINRHQNHLASITLVKPGVVRRWLLSVSLGLINLLARLWFNRGDLGGIPTILSARWVMIDGGRRLLFLDNYGGAWESYLNQFIDLSAVIGLNSIWTNTFIKAGAEKKTFGFPETQFLLWKGAQAEKPFKAYVRQSQVETIVWYSAYPTLSITNINANTNLRQSLFKAHASSELDAFFQKL